MLIAEILGALVMLLLAAADARRSYFLLLVGVVVHRTAQSCGYPRLSQDGVACTTYPDGWDTFLVWTNDSGNIYKLLSIAFTPHFFRGDVQMGRSA